MFEHNTVCCTIQCTPCVCKYMRMYVRCTVRNPCIRRILSNKLANVLNQWHVSFPQHLANGAVAIGDGAGTVSYTCNTTKIQFLKVECLSLFVYQTILMNDAYKFVYRRISL